LNEEGAVAATPEALTALDADLELGRAPGAPDLAPAPGAGTGRVGIHCLCDAFDMPALAAALEARGAPHVTRRYEEALAGHVVDVRGSGRPTGDAFYFEYGVAVFWGLTREMEDDLVALLASPTVASGPLPPAEVEVDEFEYVYAAPGGRPSIANDTLTLPHRHAADQAIKFAISHALAQSTKLSLYEERSIAIVERTRHVPATLASTGEVALSRKQVARLIGRLFLQRTAVNLRVLDTPSYFWNAPDSLQVLYKRVSEYLELEERIGVLDARFTMVAEMLAIARDSLNGATQEQLEWVVIILIVVEVIIGLFTIWQGTTGHH
jgi:uncharacterized Rmd1/YagE family protein